MRVSFSNYVFDIFFLIESIIFNKLIYTLYINVIFIN